MDTLSLMSMFFSRNFADQKGMSQYIYNQEWTTQEGYYSDLKQSSTEKEKPKEFSTTKMTLNYKES